MNRAGAALVTVLALLGFLFVTAAHSARLDRAAGAPRKQQLIRLIEARRAQVAGLDDSVAELRRQVVGADARAARASHAEDEQAAAASRLAAQAGTVAMRGGGVRVRLADAHDPGPDKAGRIHDVDAQLVVNELFAAGAEAIAINDNRIVATTAIRAAGDTLVVNFRPLRPPYVIDAIGADLGRFNRSSVAERFRHWTISFGLEFAASRRRALTVPAFSGRVALTAAVPDGGT